MKKVIAIMFLFFNCGCFNNPFLPSSLIEKPENKPITWQKMIGGSGYDRIWSIHQTNDGGYIAAGDSGSTDISGVTNQW